MADSKEISEARQLFVATLQVDRTTALRIAGYIEQFYSAQIARASRDELLNAASWAAARLREQFDASQLTRINPQLLRSSLSPGCPLCV